MLTTLQKARILARAGIRIPAFPGSHDAVDGLRESQQRSRLPVHEPPPDAPPTPELAAWTGAVEALHVEFVAARAARSLRQSHEMDILHRLRAVNAREPVQRPAKRPGLR
ncbi:MAG: hypothetical protein EOP02_01160 [Proteobacteria bacterium]|nr:MAG: hypothetical protein EOP02_01160 [Pseudomonadota bacterium]